MVAWKQYQQLAASPEQLASWWRRWPAANVAVITGRLSGIVVIDVDVRHGGDQALADLERRHGILPRLAVVATPSGGEHLYLAHPGGRIANSQGRIGAGLDVRGDGGLILLPPSRRADGEYRWVVGGPATSPEMPEAWVQLLRPRPRQAPKGKRRPSGASQQPDGPRGMRDGSLDSSEIPCPWGAAMDENGAGPG
jgi:Bifunctional DNA primase/polymerase, N-terminal